MTGRDSFIPVLARAEATLAYAARLTFGWKAAISREEARALINELARLRKTA